MTSYYKHKKSKCQKISYALLTIDTARDLAECVAQRR